MSEHINFSWVRRFQIEDPVVAGAHMISEPITDMSSPWHEIVWFKDPRWDLSCFNFTGGE